MASDGAKERAIKYMTIKHMNMLNKCVDLNQLSHLQSIQDQTLLLPLPATFLVTISTL